MTISYKTNSKATTKSLTEWFFGKDYTESMTRKAIEWNKQTGRAEFRFFKKGTGFLTIELN